MVHLNTCYEFIISMSCSGVLSSELELPLWLHSFINCSKVQLVYRMQLADLIKFIQLSPSATCLEFLILKILTVSKMWSKNQLFNCCTLLFLWINFLSTCPVCCHFNYWCLSTTLSSAQLCAAAASLAIRENFIHDEWLKTPASPKTTCFVAALRFFYGIFKAAAVNKLASLPLVWHVSPCKRREHQCKWWVEKGSFDCLFVCEADTKIFINNINILRSNSEFIDVLL